MKKVIGLIGLKGSGKTTTFNMIKAVPGVLPVTEAMLARKLKQSSMAAFDLTFEQLEDPKIKEIPFSEPVILTMDHLYKAIQSYGLTNITHLQNMYLKTLPGTVLESPRRIAQFIGTELFRALDIDIHVKSIDLGDDLTVITDMRFISEYEYFKNKEDIEFIPVYIARKSAEDAVTESSHISEKEVLEVAKKEGIQIIDNNGSEDDLTIQVYRLLSKNKLLTYDHSAPGCPSSRHDSLSDTDGTTATLTTTDLPAGILTGRFRVFVDGHHFATAQGPGYLKPQTGGSTEECNHEELTFDHKMTAAEYKESALRTESIDFEAIKTRMSDPKMIRLLHAALGLQTEVAEFSDMLKKHIFYGKVLDEVNLREELFDSTWYMAIALDSLGYSFEEGFQTNIDKLKARYPNKFTSEDAINRNLEKEREILEKK